MLIGAIRMVTKAQSRAANWRNMRTHVDHHHHHHHHHQYHHHYYNDIVMAESMNTKVTRCLRLLMFAGIQNEHKNNSVRIQHDLRTE